jgi:hypothetical protein
LTTGELVDSIELLERGDRVWVELKIIKQVEHQAGCPYSMPPPVLKEPKQDSSTLATPVAPQVPVTTSPNQMWYYDPKFLEQDIKLYLNR